MWKGQSNGWRTCGRDRVMGGEHVEGTLFDIHFLHYRLIRSYFRVQVVRKRQGCSYARHEVM